MRTNMKVALILTLALGVVAPRAHAAMPNIPAEWKDARIFDRSPVDRAIKAIKRIIGKLDQPQGPPPTPSPTPTP